MLYSCNRLKEDAQTAIMRALAEALRQGSQRVGTEHLLLALVGEENSIPARALSAMKIDSTSLLKEMEKAPLNKDLAECESTASSVPGNSFLSRLCAVSGQDNKQLPFSDLMILTLTKADNFSRYFGQDTIGTPHILLAMLEIRDTCVHRIFEEMSANLNFLRSKIMHYMASNYLHTAQPLSLRGVLISGLKQLVEKHEAALYVVQELAQKSKIAIINPPEKEKILQTVCIAYLGECLYNQVAFQRYLLEEAMHVLSQTAGAVNQEICSQIISMTAQHLRQEAREGIEYVWTNEYKLIKHMLSDAEHDLIGSIIEDLWWTYSEDIALDKSFSSALADHRRSHLLDLQKRRVELSQRLRKLQNRLDDTVRQCFAAKVSS